MINFQRVGDTLYIFTKGRFQLRTLPTGDVEISFDASDEELNQMAHDILNIEN